MPRRRRRPKARLGGPTREQKGWCLNPFGALRDVREVFAGGKREAREVWEAHRGEWLREYVLEYPGTRPPAWWLWDAPEPRDERMSEREQLARLGVLGGGE